MERQRAGASALDECLAETMKVMLDKHSQQGAVKADLLPHLPKESVKDGTLKE
jgi:hypothetical protein